MNQQIFKDRTKRLALRIIHLRESLPATDAASFIFCVSGLQREQIIVRPVQRNQSLM